MRFDVVTLFPELVEAIACYGVIARAREQGLFSVQCWNPRDYTDDVHRSVDDRPYGGGPGMVMKVEPLRDCLMAARQQAPATAKTIYLSPQGQRLTQNAVQNMAATEGLILVCGRYEGVDERFIEAYVDEEWSIGDYVLSGGEVPAIALIDAIARLLPGALGHEDSAEQDSFSAGLLDCPHYTRPETIAGRTVPAVLSSGDHGQIARWRRQQSLGRTWERRPHLIDALDLDEQDRRLLEEYQQQKSK